MFSLRALPNVLSTKRGGSLGRDKDVKIKLTSEGEIDQRWAAVEESLRRFEQKVFDGFRRREATSGASGNGVLRNDGPHQVARKEGKY